MDKEVAIFAKPEELITWADQFDILLNITREEAELLLNYMEGHDYAIGHNEEGQLYQVDIAEENGEVMELKIDDIIDTVCNWNYDLILCTNAIKEETDSFEELVQADEKIKALTADESVLEKLFDRTFYGKQVSEEAKKISDGIAIMVFNESLATIKPAVVMDEKPIYQTGKRGR